MWLQGGRFMVSAMFDAREVLIPGSAYDRSNTNVSNGKFYCHNYWPPISKLLLDIISSVLHGILWLSHLQLNLSHFAINLKIMTSF